jgi:hypothetical protein
LVVEEKRLNFDIQEDGDKNTAGEKDSQ